ncbi:unnamed protein product, partial [Effrenium voratum]
MEMKNVQVTFDVADLSELTHPRQPALKLCTMSANGHLNIPREVRDKWLQEQFDEKYKTTTATVSLNMGQTVTCHLVENKAKDFLGKTANENKAVELEVAHTDFSVFKPNPVNEKKAKGTNVAGVIGFKALSNSPYLQLV